MNAGRKKGIPNRPKTERLKRDELKPATEAHINGHIQLMREIGIPESRLYAFKLRLKHECKNKKEVDDMVTRMKLGYFAEVWNK